MTAVPTPSYYDHPKKIALFNNDFGIKTFAELDRVSQLAIAWYMGIDGEAWEEFMHFDEHTWPDVKEDYSGWKSKMLEIIDQALPEILKRHGQRNYGVGTWPASDLLASVADDETFQRPVSEITEMFNKEIELYHTTRYPHENRWPVIMSSREDETFEDGWHRFHIYVSNGHPDIPIIFFPEDWHYNLKKAPSP